MNTEANIVNGGGSVDDNDDGACVVGRGSWAVVIVMILDMLVRCIHESISLR